MFKRSFDLVGATLFLILSAPAMMLFALAIKLDSPGPVFFRQQRIGKAGKPFRICKFRTMIEGADALKPTLQAENEAVGLFKIADDPRVTGVGRLLRRSSLDSFPSSSTSCADP